MLLADEARRIIPRRTFQALAAPIHLQAQRDRHKWAFWKPAAIAAGACFGSGALARKTGPFSCDGTQRQEAANNPLTILLIETCL